MNVDKRSFGNDAENSEDFDFENNFNFHHSKNKNDIEQSLSEASKDLEDFFLAVSEDAPEPTQDEIDSGIQKILERANAGTTDIKAVKNGKSKKSALKVLFLVALLSILSLSGIYVVGNNNDISIENGFVTFAKDTVRVVLFGEENEEYISVDTLLIDLEKHGYKDILFPEIFITKSDEYKVSVPKYIDGDLSQVSFEIRRNELLCAFTLYESEDFRMYDATKLENADKILLNDIDVYMFKFNDHSLAYEFYNEGYCYFLSFEGSYLDMEEIVKTIK